jgi:hypothetical protein
MTKRDEPDFDPKPRTAKKQPEGDRATGARIFTTYGPAVGTRDEIRRFPNVHYRHQHRQLTVHRRSKKNPDIGGRTRRHRKHRSTRRR